MVWNKPRFVCLFSLVDDLVFYDCCVLMCPGSRGLSPSGRSLSGEESHSESSESDDSDEEQTVGKSVSS